MADKPQPVTLTAEEAAALRAVLAMVVEDEVRFALGRKTAAYERALAKLEGRLR